MSMFNHPSARSNIDLIEQARQHLRNTHFGLDTEIERVLDAFVPWLLLGHTQQRPRMLGLWGMTGTGKSSLVRSLVEALGLEERTFWLDAGECRRTHWLNDQLVLLSKHHDGKPFLLVVDEFQHARTVKAGTEQDEAPELRRLWELMDAGRSVLEHPYLRTDELIDLCECLHDLLRKGVFVKHGRVTKGLPLFVNGMTEYRNEIDKATEHWALPRSTWSFVRDHFEEPMSLNAFQQLLETLDGPGLVHLLREQITRQRKPRILDAGMALVVVLGNLDSLYVMGREPLPELDPDVLLARHHHLGTAGVHKALLQLFRVEQVARLGTDHVIFPPLGSMALYELVRRRADDLIARLRTDGCADLSVGDGLLRKLCQGATIPALGARPVVEAVDQVLPALLAQVLLHSQYPSGLPIRLDVAEAEPIARLGEGSVARTLPLRWPGGRMQHTTMDQVQLRRYAVHESGHVLCGSLLLQREALQACARTSHPNVGGFVVWADDNRAITEALVAPHLAQMLGGWAAERLVYGAASAGSQDDLYKASAFALELVKAHGLGPDRLHHAEHPEAPGNGFRTGRNELEAHARGWIEAAEQLALETLAQNRPLLDHLTAQLIEKGSLDREQLAVSLAQTGKQHNADVAPLPQRMTA